MIAARDALSCSFEDAALNHLRDNLAMTADQRWAWLREAMELAATQARRRAQQGGLTTDANREIWWSPLHEDLWGREHRLPRPDELAKLASARPR